MQNQNESGRSMIEMLGVLAIMGVIVYGAVAGINFGIDMYKINATYNEIDELAKAIIDLHSWTRNYDRLNSNPVNLIKTNDAYPTYNCSQYEGGNPANPCARWVLLNQWGGEVTVAPHTSANPKNFKITYEDVPEAACDRLKSETGFSHVCLCPSEVHCNNSSRIIFYSRGSNECNPDHARYQACNP